MLNVDLPAKLYLRRRILLTGVDDSKLATIDNRVWSVELRVV